MKYQVATFCEPGETRRSKVRAYSRHYHQQRAGCLVHNVAARNGAEARRLAVTERLRIEAQAAISIQGRGGAV